MTSFCAHSPKGDETQMPLQAVNKTKRTAYNAVASLLNLVVNNLLSFLLIRVVLLKMGSDYNGLNSTTAQFLSILLIFENSFTNAIQVALYKPFQSGDLENLNALCTKAKKTFNLCGLIMFGGGLVSAAVFALTVKSGYDYPTIFAVIAISVISSMLSSLLSSRYRVLFQVSQSEYIVTLITAICHTLSQISAFILVHVNVNIIQLRLSYAAFSVLQCVVICAVGRKMFKDVNFSVKGPLPKIKGTKEVMVSVSTSVVYRSAPTFYLTSFLGTVFTSIYAVYKSILGIIENVLWAILNAPKNAVGQTLSSDDQENKNRIINQYEFTVILFATVLLSVTYSLLVPFIKLYTAGVNDANYVNEAMAALMVLSSYATFLHVPAGTCINLSGQFKLMQKNQIIALAALIVGIVIGGFAAGIYGILSAVLAVAVLLAVLEIRGSRKYVITSGYGKFLKVLFVNGITGAAVSVFGKLLLSKYITSYIYFFLIAAVMTVITACIIFLANYLIFKNDCKQLVKRFMGILRRRAK